MLLDLDALQIRDTLLPMGLRVAGYLNEAYARHLQATISVRRKADSSLITEADTTAHQMLSYDLNKLYPDIPVISEEGAFGSAAEREQWPLYWLVDPLDGTREFVEKTDEFCINIALMKEGRPWFGMVVLPMAEQIFVGGDEIAACEYRDGQWHDCVPAQSDDTLRVVISSRSVHYPPIQTLRLKLHQSGVRFETIIAGSAYKYVELLKYRLAIYPRYGSTSHWDTAAGHALLNAAGGQLLVDGGEEMQYPCETLLNSPFLGLSPGCAKQQQFWLSLF